MMNRRGLSFLPCLSLALCIAAAAVFPHEIVEEKVIIKTMVGKVEIQSRENPKWRPARAGMAVKSGWDIRTYVESEAMLEFETGTVLRVGENSVVTLSALLLNKSLGNATRSKVTVASGELWGNVKELVNNRSQFEFETPTATAAIRGTRLGVRVTKGETRLDVYDGVVEMKRPGSECRSGHRGGANMRAVAQEGKDQITGHF